jgi:acetylornithine/N-succinyldiaminopimelate aminotransferase
MSGLSPLSLDQPADPLRPVVTDRPLDFSGAFESLLGGSVAEAALHAGEPTSQPEASADALIAKLLPVSFGDRALLVPSEAEAWKIAVETIRRYHQIVGRPKRRRLIVSVGALADDGRLPPGLEGDDEITILPTDDLGAWQAEISPKTAGFLVAPVSTRNGLDVLAGSFLAGLREAADDYGLVLAFDETFCSLGRSGMVWAHEWTGVTPDLMILTQGLAGALPLAALVMTQKHARGAPESQPIVDQGALEAGHAAMDALLSPGFEERVQNRAWYLEDRLASLFFKRRDLFEGVCGIGLMQGLVCKEDAEPMRAKLAERGLLMRAMGPVLGLFPPLTVEESEIDAAIDAICAALPQVD